MEQAKKDPELKDIPILVWTNLDNQKSREKAKQLGADGYIFKNEVMPRELVEIIKDTIAKKINKV